MDIFCRRVACTHIHDNLGRGEEKAGDPDLHLLPFDGNTDYAHVMRKLEEYGYRGPLTLEVSAGVAEEYEKMSPEAFLAECHARLERISKL